VQHIDVSIAVYRRGLFSTRTSPITLFVPRQHGGESHLQNLAWACLRCNRYKGPNVGSFDPETGRLVPFFNPRTQDWATHFAWEGATIQPLAPEGRVTVTILRFNDADRVAERQRLMAAGLYG
jgi:hypothetical protein